MKNKWVKKESCSLETYLILLIHVNLINLITNFLKSYGIQWIIWYPSYKTFACNKNTVFLLDTYVCSTLTKSQMGKVYTKFKTAITYKKGRKIIIYSVLFILFNSKLSLKIQGGRYLDMYSIFSIFCDWKIL